MAGKETTYVDSRVMKGEDSTDSGKMTPVKVDPATGGLLTTADAGSVPEPFVGTTGAAPAVTTVTFAATSKAVLIMNADTADSLQFSLDGGTTYITLAPSSSVGDNWAVASVKIKAVTNTADYVVIAR